MHLDSLDSTKKKGKRKKKDPSHGAVWLASFLKSWSLSWPLLDRLLMPLRLGGGSGNGFLQHGRG
jgi:hypothetical protein